MEAVSHGSNAFMEGVYKKRWTILLSVLALAAVVASSTAHAFTAPTTGQFMYEAYDFFINDLLKGPVGFVISAVCVLWGLFSVRGNWIMGLVLIIIGTVVFKIDAITQSFGAMVTMVDAGADPATIIKLVTAK
jgi:ABC-type antimicrobial peptide transport system permease subunit